MRALNRSTIIILATIAIVMVAFGIVIPILPSYLESMGASGRDLGLLTATFAVAQLFTSPVWGNISDRIGRKPVIIFGLVGCALTLLLYGLVTHLWMMYLVRILAGVLASATFPTAMAYIGDTTSEEERSGGMGLISAAQYAGIMLGPALGGWLSAVSATFPFYFASGMCVVLLGFALLFLPESLPPERRVRTPGGSWLSGPDFPAMWRALRGPVGYLLFLSFLISFGLNCFWSVFGLYALQRYGYGPGPVGTIMAAIGVGSTVVQAGLTDPLTRKWGETRLIRVALAASAVGFLIMLPATTFVTVLLTACFFVMANSLLRPVVTALISKRTEQGQGTAMGLNNAFMSLGQIVGPIWAGYTLDANLFLPYLSGALVMLAGLGLECFRGVARKQRCAVKP
ncbi:MAG: MFS transporter [Anaerolineae bacterium]|nr:MFS transporter [Anaerolineae bacterium]